MTRKYEIKKFSNLDLSYFAGLIDSDGSITIIKSIKRSVTSNTIYYSYTPWIQIAQIDHQALRELASKFDVGSYTNITQNKKIFKRVIFTGKKCYKFLKLIYKYLRIKKQQGTCLLQFEKIVKSKPNLYKIKINKDKIKVKNKYISAREKIVVKIRKLNGKHKLPLDK